jgi:hypothetical protein
MLNSSYLNIIWHTLGLKCEALYTARHHLKIFFDESPASVIFFFFLLLQ